MATNFKAKRKKLYFDIPLNRNATNFVVTCTQFTAGTPGDRYGNLLEALMALSGSTPPPVRTRNAVSAWYVPNLIVVSNATSLGNTPVMVEFCQPTARGSGVAALKLLPYLTAGTLTPLNQFSGHEAIYSITAGTLRHFAVRVRRRVTSVQGGVSISGTLCVQRQHSLEV